MLDLKDKILSGERINKEEGTSLFKWNLLTLGHLANSIRQRMHADPVVTYIVDRNINYTTVTLLFNP